MVWHAITLTSAGLFLRTSNFLSESRHFTHFMAPECSLPCSQQPDTCVCPEADQSSLAVPSCYFKMCLVMMGPSAPSSWKFVSCLQAFHHKQLGQAELHQDEFQDRDRCLYACSVQNRDTNRKVAGSIADGVIGIFH
jgi:hypothetical protein